MTQTAPPRATRREWIGLAVIALPCLLYSMDLTVLHLAIPKLSADLQPSSSELLWIIDIYGFLVAGSLITMGTLGDRLGRRRMLLVGALVFSVASVLAAFAPTTELLIAARAVLGLAGATVAPSTLSLIRNMFPDPQQRTSAIGVWITSYSVGAAIGPLVGGVLLQYYWWGSVFLIAVPVMGVLLVLGPMLLPEYRDPEAGRPDLLSAVLSLAAVLSMIYGLKQVAQDGLAAAPLLFILAGFALGAMFIRRQITAPDPLLDLRLFRSAAFSGSLAAYGLSMFVMLGGFLFFPQYLQLVVGLSPLEAGVWSLPFTAAFIIGPLATPALARRFSPASVMAAGMVVSAAGFALLTQVTPTSTTWLAVIATVVFALGISPVVTLTTDLIVGSAPPEKAGAASALSETSAEFSGAVGIAVFGSIGVALYRRLMEGALPASLTPEAAEAARSTLGGAVAVAAQLPADVALALVTSARSAFIAGLQTGSAIAAVGALGIAALVLVVIRRAQPPAEPTGGATDPEAQSAVA
jgi:DHA2 family multidrug resistance protein-like MFS transporter